jgi:hypothetical protein
MFVRTGKHKKKQKNIFFNYFLIYLVALIVIIALYTKNIILIIRCRINRNCFDIYSQIKLDGLSFEIFFTINSFYKCCFQHLRREQQLFLGLHDNRNTTDFILVLN